MGGKLVKRKIGGNFERLPDVFSYARLDSAAHSARALLRVLRLGLQGAVLQGGTQAVWAGVAQLVEHLICNQRVGGSNPFVSSISPSQNRYPKVRSVSSSNSSTERRIWLYCLPSWQCRPPVTPSRQAFPSDSQLESKHGLDRQGRRLKFKARRRQQSAQVAEWLMAADCKSAALCATEVRILPCAPYFCSAGEPVDLSPAGSGRMIIALAVLGLLAILSWQTMQPGNYRSLTWILLGFFAFRVVLGRLRSR